MTPQPPPIHEYTHHGVLHNICKHRGLTQHTKPYEGFNYWLGGIGLKADPGCVEN